MTGPPPRCSKARSTFLTLYDFQRSTMTDDSIADYLRHPDFFERHAELLTACS
jgi:hypothetical protein